MSKGRSRTIAEGDPDPVLRSRLRRAASKLRVGLSGDGALLSAWEDLLKAWSDEVAFSRAATLLALVSEAGLDVDEVVKGLEQLLRDSALRVAKLRGEPTGAFNSLNERAGASVVERVNLCRKLLSLPPTRGRVVVWLRYLLAPLPEGTTIDISDRVTIYSKDALAAAWDADVNERLPPELREGKRPHNLASMAGIPEEDEQDPDPAEQGPPDDEEADDRPPHALIRVDLGEVLVAEAVDLARETADLLVSLAVLHGADPSIWLLTDDYCKFIDDKAAGASFSAPPVFVPSLEQRSAMLSDRLPHVLDEWAERLALHLPMTRPDLRRGAQSAYWMRRARETWEPGRLVLYDRVFEQVAGWAGFTDLNRFIEDCLRPSWPLGRVRNEITNSWAAVHRAGSGPFREMSTEAWAEIAARPSLEYEPRDDGGWVVNLRGVLLELDFILARLQPLSPLHERIEQLSKRTADAKATQKWIKALDNDFVALRGRWRRLRNALVHGGPVGEGSTQSVLPFAEWLTTDALHTALDGLLAGEELIDHFLERREAQLRVSERMRLGDLPADTIFWETKD